ncbi:hypothetical protein [Rhizorhabdus histidinilytica]|uniref:hypothetical protein n=1 Tax=Rhizorhabdus histidinilytica TaxID=439228 RepID=UPI00322018EB
MGFDAWISPEGAGAVVAIAGAAGAAGAWIERRLAEARAAVPIFRPHYSNVVDGILTHITIVNRLNEDLTIERVDAEDDIFVGEVEYDAGGSIIRESQKYHPSPVRPNWLVPALGQETYELWSPRSGFILLTVSSSSRTIRSKRFKLELSQKE